MTIDIDEHSGFCFGVTGAIRRAEEELANGQLFCLGDIVHNSEEVKRLADKGLETIDYDDLRTMHNVRVLFRAHGEPPSTYHIAEQNRIHVIDASCPVVLALQKRIRTCYQNTRGTEAQIAIYGQVGHAEVIGLQGQTNNTAIVLEGEEDLHKLNFHHDIYLFSQTTKSVEGFRHIAEAIRAEVEAACGEGEARPVVNAYDTICRNVANRVENIKAFAREHEFTVFVGGRKSSNAKVLYNHCLSVNPGTVFVTGPEELTEDVLPQGLAHMSIGITGATSTPHWLMESCRTHLQSIITKQ